MAHAYTYRTLPSGDRLRQHTPHRVEEAASHAAGRAVRLCIPCDVDKINVFSINSTLSCFILLIKITKSGYFYFIKGMPNAYHTNPNGQRISSKDLDSIGETVPS